MASHVPAARQSTAKSTHTAAELHDLAQKHLAKEQRYEEERKSWSPMRECLHGFIHGHGFEGACAVIILFNLVLVVLETDATSAEEEVPVWVKVMTQIFLTIYTVELISKLFIFRCHFFEDRWNLIDLVVVGMDLLLLIVGTVVEEMPSVAVLRVFRLVRLARAFKAANFFHELHVLLRSFTCAIKAIGWGIIMIALCLIVWAILAVQLLHPVNVSAIKNKPHIYDECERCPRAFSTVFNAMLTLFQTAVTGDAWAEVSTVVIEEAPWTALFMLSVLMTVSLTMLNLILTTTLEAGANAALADEHENAIQVRKNAIKAEKKLIKMCASLDTNHDGQLNLEEFLDGFAHHEEFQDAVGVMNVNEKDLRMIFNICDEDGSGEVNYHEFVEQLRRIKDSGAQMLLYYIADVRHMVNRMGRTLGTAPSTSPSIAPAHSIRSFKTDHEVSHGEVGEISATLHFSYQAAEPKERSGEVGCRSSTIDGMYAPPVVMEEVRKRVTEAKLREDSPDQDALCTAITELQQQLTNIIQEFPIKMDSMLAESSHGEQISRMNDNISTSLQLSKAQTGLLNKLVDEAEAFRDFKSRSKGSLPVFPFKSIVAGKGGEPGASSSAKRESTDTDAACCTVRVA